MANLTTDNHLKCTAIAPEFLVRGLDNLRADGMTPKVILPDTNYLGQLLQFFVFYEEPEQQPGDPRRIPDIELF